jgi:hypothetical protein
VNYYHEDQTKALPTDVDGVAVVAVSHATVGGSA